LTKGVVFLRKTTLESDRSGYTYRGFAIVDPEIFMDLGRKVKKCVFYAGFWISGTWWVSAVLAEAGR
jgi:hypothetical protein